MKVKQKSKHQKHKVILLVGEHHVDEVVMKDLPDLNAVRVEVSNVTMFDKKSLCVVDSLRR